MPMLPRSNVYQGLSSREFRTHNHILHKNHVRTLNIVTPSRNESESDQKNSIKAEHHDVSEVSKKIMDQLVQRFLHRSN